jgi:hypothetical protein
MFAIVRHRHLCELGFQGHRTEESLSLRVLGLPICELHSSHTLDIYKYRATNGITHRPQTIHVYVLTRHYCKENSFHNQYFDFSKQQHSTVWFGNLMYSRLLTDVLRCKSIKHWSDRWWHMAVNPGPWKKRTKIFYEDLRGKLFDWLFLMLFLIF